MGGDLKQLSLSIYAGRAVGTFVVRTALSSATKAVFTKRSSPYDAISLERGMMRTRRDQLCTQSSDRSDVSCTSLPAYLPGRALEPGQWHVPMNGSSHPVGKINAVRAVSGSKCKQGP